MSDARLYATTVNAAAIGTAVQDMLSLKAGTGVGLVLHWIKLTAGGSITTPVEIRVRLKKLTGTMTQGSGGSTPTKPLIDSGDQRAAVSTVHANDTTQATGTGSDTLIEEYWNQLIPFEFMPTPEMRPKCISGEGFALDLPAAIGAAFAGSITCYFEETP